MDPQYITDHIFKQLIKQVTSRTRTSEVNDRVETLSYEEKKHCSDKKLVKMKWSGQLSKDGVELCLIDLIMYNDKTGLNLRQRGLLYINTKTFLV